MHELAARPEVKAIQADRGTGFRPVEAGAAEEARVDAVEWGIDRIRAPLVWSTLQRPRRGHRGRQHRHRRPVRPSGARAPVPRQPGRRQLRPQLQLVRPVARLRQPVNVPCDNNGHGTHTMGTMVGDDGDAGPNQIGVAPAREVDRGQGLRDRTPARLRRCSPPASGSWRPTDLAGEQPAARPAPPRRQQLVGRRRRRPVLPGRRRRPGWRRASSPPSRTATPGPAAARAGSPGDYADSYGAGAFDINDSIASFSSRGPSVVRPASSSPTSRRRA